jgi:hypothetical protein
MPVAGAKPKPQGQAITRTPQVHEWIEVANVPFKRGRKLPQRRANGRLWPSQARRMWEAWASMPHAKLWSPSDWEFALVTIELAALVYEGEPKYATELRNRERILGTTMDFRRDLRIRYVEPKKADVAAGGCSAGVANLADYREA